MNINGNGNIVGDNNVIFTVVDVGDDPELRRRQVWVVLTLIAVLLICAFGWIDPVMVFGLSVVAVYLIYRVIGPAVNRISDARAVRAAEQREIAARADQQHNWAMQGDPRGVTGHYPPAC